MERVKMLFRSDSLCIVHLETYGFMENDKYLFSPTLCLSRSRWQYVE